MIAGDGDRERAAAFLREHFVRGRLTVEELASRVERVFVARSQSDLGDALAGLPVRPDARALARSAARGVKLAVFTSLYVCFSVVLLFVFGLTLLIHGASGTVLIGFLLVWLVPTYLLSRLWRKHPTKEGR